MLGNITNKKTIISSTTSTILSNELSQFVKFPERFLNAHWLNPPYLMPLIEISPAKETNIKNINKIFKLSSNKENKSGDYWWLVEPEKYIKYHQEWLNYFIYIGNYEEKRILKKIYH